MKIAFIYYLSTQLFYFISLLYHYESYHFLLQMIQAVVVYWILPLFSFPILTVILSTKFWISHHNDCFFIAGFTISQ